MPNPYSDEDDDESSPAEAENKSTDSDENNDGNTALLPKSFFGGHKCKVGDIKKIRVEHIYSDEYEVSYVGKDDSKDKEDKDEDSDTMKESMGKMDEAYS